MTIYAQFCRFSYRNFQKVGRGGSGVVFKGLLTDERKVEVKKLSDMIYLNLASLEEFIVRMR
jgi:hypothetical protein